MKKVIILISTIFFSFVSIFASLSPKKVNAENYYLRVINENTPFYVDANGQSLLFYLPYTYYVKIINYGKEYTHVECYGTFTAGLDGYVPNDLLFDDGLEVSNPYPNIELTTSTTCILFADFNLKQQQQFIFANRSLNYYGTYTAPNGEILYYVGYNERLGYVKESQVMPFTIPNHPNPLTFIVPEEEENPLPENDNDKNMESYEKVDPFHWIILGLLILAGLISIVIVVTGKQRNNKTAISYYEENDYE